MIRLIKSEEIFQDKAEHIRKVRFLGVWRASERIFVSEALDDLLRLKENDLAQFKRLTDSIRYVATNKIIHNHLHVRKDKYGRKIYEFRGGGGKTNCAYRLLFSLEEKGDIVVCANLYEKDPNQEASFDRAARYLRYYELEMEAGSVTIDS